MSEAPLYQGPTLAEFERAALERWPDREAIVGGGVRVTFREFSALVNRYARFLKLLGLQRGDALAVLSPSRVELTAAEHGAQILGVRTTPLHPMGSYDDHVFILQDAEIDALLVDTDNYAEHGRRLAERVPLKHVITLGAADFGVDAIAASAAQMIIYGAAPMSPTRLREGIEVFGPIFCQLYAQTEICVRGPIVMDRYWKRPDETRKALQGGWLHTGDVARRDGLSPRGRGLSGRAPRGCDFGGDRSARQTLGRMRHRLRHSAPRRAGGRSGADRLRARTERRRLCAEGRRVRGGTPGDFPRRARQEGPEGRFWAGRERQVS